MANQFIIRHIDPASSDFLYSSNIFAVAERNGFYDSERDGPYLDFLKTFAPQRAHSPYVTRSVTVTLTHPSLAADTSEVDNSHIRPPPSSPVPRNIGCEKSRICFFSSFDCANINRDVITNSIADFGP